ncbi:MAG: RNA polymerase sigma factor, partial [Pseudomonadales bacterium]
NTGINFYNSKARLERNSVPPEEELDLDGPETETIALETRRTLHDSITQLPSPMRDALVLNMLKGHDYETISRVLHCPIGTVRSRISRARTTVANALAA